MTAPRHLTFRLGEGQIEITVGARGRPLPGDADTDRLLDEMVAATKQAGGTVTQQTRSEVPL